MKNVGTLETKMTGSKREISEETENVNSKPIPLEISLKELDFITARMRKIALIIFAFTLFNIFFPVFIFSGALYTLVTKVFTDREYPYGTTNASIVIWIIILFMTLIMIYIYESFRKKGDVLFEEISDELEWNVKNHPENQGGNERPEINARISLRSFVKTTDLPFIPGKFGPAFYLVFNVLIPLFIGSRFLF